MVFCDNEQLNKDIDEISSDRALFEPFGGSAILITGATGLIGSMLVRSFCAAEQRYGLGIRLLLQSRGAEKLRALLKTELSLPFVDIIEGEVTDIDVVCDYIIHTASPTSSKYFIEHPVETIRASVEGTAAMLGLCVRNKARMLYLSSMEQYGQPYGDDVVMTEDRAGYIDSLSIRSCYPQSKRLCECMCASYASEYGADVVIARLSQTFGAGVPKSDNRMPVQFAKAVIGNTDIVLHTEGRSMCNMVYITDAVSGLLTCLNKGTAGAAYNICNDAETRSVREIAELVAKEVAEGSIGVKIEIPKENMGYAPDVRLRLDSGRIKGLGWKPRVGMKEAYLRLVRYLSDQS